MSESNTVISSTTNSILDALERVRPELAQMTEEELLPITAEPVTAGMTMRGALPRIMALRPQLEKLNDFDVKALDKLEDYLHAWLGTHAMFLGTTLPPERFASLVEKVSVFRDNLASDAQALVQRGILRSDALSNLKGAVGHKNIVSDVLTLTMIFRNNWQRIAGRTAVTEAELNEASNAADILITDLALREPTPPDKEATAIERQKAYTLFVSAYDEVRRGVSFLRWKHGDTDEIAPSLFGGKKRKAASTETAVVEPTITTTTTTTTTGAATHAGDASTTSVSGTVPAAATPGIGLPGSDPFTN
jgi:hypothetical protein